MINYFFTIQGDRISGKYIVVEWKDGKSNKILEINERYYGGLKESRQFIGDYLRKSGHPCTKVFQHQCIKPNRKNNPYHDWTVEEYLIGVPLK
ncbi:hypothetical protein [Bacillus infantis]|uniref:hypothetical protein n=1 Tax=Bacillus infantis TaxID=324767 RepID=UPI0021556913|nr:hypothetical protein [Bacillus infantis]MCR6609450.1 hypothetical protein [Bacillus infantis]